ncbi:unnamed protein product [Clavelina lepadiformis]|uniref:Uncharacterized protein n=1 Tax=Clavelina lepadiformis TaxID=159417 RepID=A0ABP0GAJ9_CLALP
MNRSSVLRCGLDLLDNGNVRNLNMTPVGWEALATAINKLPQPGDIADGNLETQEYETTHRELTDRLVAVSDVSDCRPMFINKDASSVRSEQLRSKVNLRAAEPPSRRPNASTKHDKAASPKTN